MGSPNHLLVAIGVKPKPSTSQPPRSLRDHLMGGSASGGAVSQPGASSSATPTDAGQKASREEAGFIPAGQICGSCQNFTKETGDCSSVEGQFQAHDTCKNYYEAANGSQGGGDMATLIPGMSSGSQPSQSGAGALRGA